MCKFGSCVNYLTIDLINLFQSCGSQKFIDKRNEYLQSQKVDATSNLYQLDEEKMQKLITFIDTYVDSLTCENEMKMEIFFNQDEPAFINDEVNCRLFNFYHADKIYQFAQEHSLDMRIHTIVWYRHFPRQITDYLKKRTSEEKRTLTLKFIRAYMEELHNRYPNCYCVDVINEMAADPSELKDLQAEDTPAYEFDEDGVRKDDWYMLLGKDYYIEVLRIAREVFGTDTKLFYNDNNEGNKEKQIYFQNILLKIKTYEAEHHVRLLDGFGMQMHLWGDETSDFLREMFEFYTGLNIELQITEFDVSCHDTKERQAQIFEDFIRIISEYPIKIFTMWGFNDALSWLSDENPLIIDSNYDKKTFADRYLAVFSQKAASKKEV